MPDDLQPRALRAFTALHQLHSSWAGSLILSLGLDAAGSALSIASNIAGAVSLAIDDDPSRLREVIRTGACDFVVNTLDEAIRAMKNEVRKGAPLSVALSANPALALAEIIDRGLAPQLFTIFIPASQSPRNEENSQLLARAAAHFASLGATLVHFNDPLDGASAQEGFLNSEGLIAPLAEQNLWTLQSFTFSSPAGLRAFDARALALLPAEDTLRRRWLEAAPRILQRQRPPRRSLWLTRQEAEVFAA